MEPEPRVSVIIPVYNGEKTLESCLNSVLSQTYKNYEIMVVDNNSTDKTKEIIYNLKESSDRIRYIFAERRSTGAARNEGVRAAQGDIFVFTDADCVCPPNWLEEITRPIRLEKENATVGFEDDLLKNYWTKNIQKRDEIYMQRCSYGKYTRAFDTKNAAIKAQFMKELMFDPDITVCDDLDLGIRINAKSKICYLPAVRVGHFHRNSLKNTIKTQFFRAFWSHKIYKKYKKFDYIRNYKAFESMYPKDWLLFPFRTLLSFIKNPPGEACFILLSGLCWGTGLLWPIITTFCKNLKKFLHFSCSHYQ